MPMLDVRKLVLLAEVVEAGSITAAATALNYTPSAVSQQLRQLEIEVGQPLLQRQPRGVTATEAGAVLAQHARRVERQIGAAEADLAEIVGLHRGHLTIGTFPSIGSSLLPQAIIAFRALHPGIELSVRSAWFDPLTEMLDNGTLGLSLLWDYDWNRIPADRYDLTPILDDPTMLVVSNNHPAARRRSITMNKLADEQWVVRANNHPVVEVLLKACHAVGFEPRISFYANDCWELQAMVSVGPRHRIRPADRNNKQPPCCAHSVAWEHRASASHPHCAPNKPRARLSRSHNATRAPRCGTHILAPADVSAS
jgi:DNA-binding transcriptional LysR family regulator